MDKTYAHILWQLVEKGMQPKKAVRSLFEVLSKHGRTSLMPHIARAFSRIAQREGDKNTLVLTIAQEKDRRTATAHAKDTIHDTGVNSKDVDVRIDASLIGGWRLEGKERLIDASFKKYLLSLYNRATQ